MAVNDKIITSDYNTLQARVANILGNGSGNLGYGQDIQSTTVDTSSRVSINEWGKLRNDIVNIYRHQNNSLPSTSILPEAVEGNKVRYAATGEPITVWDGFITTIQSARTSAPPAGRLATQFATTRSSALSWSAGATVDIQVSWLSANEARYFFNGGGQVRIGLSFTNFAGNAQGNSWANILASGTPTLAGYSGLNWYDLTPSNQTLYSLSGSSPYGSNQVLVYARTPGGNNSSGTQSFCQFTVNLIDAYTDPPTGDPDNPPPDDFVSGRLQVDINYVYGTGALTGLTSTWKGYLPNTQTIGSISGF